MNRKKTNYLNNKDILKEIHTSKNTYCSFIEKEYHRYDLIIDMPESSIEDSLAFAKKDEQIKTAREIKAARLSQETNTKIAIDDVSEEGLIFRVMTWEHIPLSQKQPRKTTKKKSAKEIFSFEDDDIPETEDDTETDEAQNLVHDKVNFPPFQHFMLKDGAFVCVGKSHWVGGMENGHFSKDHGQITNKLAHMYMMLCEKYAMKYNWRGYTYNDEMRGSAILQLSYVGLRFNEAKSANPFAYYTAAINNSFCRVLNTEKRNQNIRDDVLEINGLNPSYTRQLQNSNSND